MPILSEAKQGRRRSDYLADQTPMQPIDSDVSPPSFFAPVIARHNLSAIGNSTPSSFLIHQ